MRKLISPAEMLRCERAYFEYLGIPSIDFMESAAIALFGNILTHYIHAQTIYFACGPGGNGGDGYACARLAQEAGMTVRIFETCAPKAADAIENRQRAIEAGIPFGGDELPEPDVWVDCLFGTGLSREPDEKAAELISRMNHSGAKVVSADIPSGLNGKTGRKYRHCVKADLTVTFELEKYGHYLQDGPDMCGKIEVAKIGFGCGAFPENLPGLFTPEDMRRYMAPRQRNIHKGDCGHLLIVAGSLGMAGAAVLCTKAALRSGVGLVTVACPESIVPILQMSAPCAMCIPLPEENGAISREAVPVLKEAFLGKRAVAVGPGLSRRAASEAIQAVLESGLPAVMDADALNIIAGNPDLKALLGSGHILTPHPGEAARLLDRKCESPVDDALLLAESGATVVLKGASRVISDGAKTYISTRGSSAMARGGSGDVLTGMLGATLARGFDCTRLRAVAEVCEIHGMCGEAAAEKYGTISANAADLIEMLPEVYKKYAP